MPPFSVLDARQGYWRRRKAAWIRLGVEGEQGREEGLVYNEPTSHPDFYIQKRQCERRLGRSLSTLEFRTKYYRPTGRVRGTSVFDPVLAELAYCWFCTPGGRVLDPFAGEATKGLVATYLGYRYTGIELRAEQIRANQKQARRMGLTPRWIRGDSAALQQLLPTRRRYDLVFTSPPYYDLEIYSKQKRDGSTLRSYPVFIEWLAEIFRQAAARLRKNRCFVVKVGEIRDRTGAYRNFVGDTVAILARDCGLAYLNEAILLTAAGSLPMRAGHPFATGRKLGKTHQNLLVFYKGDPRELRRHFPPTVDNANLTDPSQAN